MFQNAAMDYIIGAGAMLETGEQATITPATLHAHVDPALAGQVVAAAVDFEGTSPESLRRLLVLAQGWSQGEFRSRVTDPLRRSGDCTLAQVFELLAEGAGTKQVHLFAHWLPDEATCAYLRGRGIELVAHPLEAIEAAALVSGQRCRRWHAA